MVAVARRRIVNTSVLLHQEMVDIWSDMEKKHKESAGQLLNRWERKILKETNKTGCKGDELVARVRDIFFNGLGIEWGEDQKRVFNTFVFSCLPLIYGNEWQENKARVLKEWDDAKRECPYTVVSMARRNGKTYVTSGTVVSLMLAIPGIKVAIFSTCKRTSGMMMEACVGMLEKAMEIGTHCNNQDYQQISKNMESVILLGPDGSKRVLGCFPGSVRVSIFFFFFMCACVCAM